MQKPLPLSRLIGTVQAAENLLHFTALSNVQSILSTGLLSPCEARQRGKLPGLGSGGSNESAVQLFDYRQLSRLQAWSQAKDLLENLCFWPGGAVLVIRSDLRSHQSFRTHAQVKSFAESHRPVLRYYPFTEVWVEEDRIPPESVVEVWQTGCDEKRLRTCRLK